MKSLRPNPDGYIMSAVEPATILRLSAAAPADGTLGAAPESAAAPSGTPATSLRHPLQGDGRRRAVRQSRRSPRRGPDGVPGRTEDRDRCGDRRDRNPPRATPPPLGAEVGHGRRLPRRIARGRLGVGDYPRRRCDDLVRESRARFHIGCRVGGAQSRLGVESAVSTRSVVPVESVVIAHVASAFRACAY